MNSERKIGFSRIVALLTYIVVFAFVYRGLMLLVSNNLATGSVLTKLDLFYLSCNVVIFFTCFYIGGRKIDEYFAAKLKALFPVKLKDFDFEAEYEKAQTKRHLMRLQKTLVRHIRDEAMAVTICKHQAEKLYNKCDINDTSKESADNFAQLNVWRTKISQSKNTLRNLSETSYWLKKQLRKH